MDIKVVYKDPETGVLRIGIADPPEFVSGIDKLVQIVAIELMTSPGRNISNPSSGGNVRSLVGSNIAFDDVGEIFAEIRMMVSSSEKNIIDFQGGGNRPSSEKIARLELLDIIPDEENMQLEIVIQIISMDQQTAQAIIGVK